jgi:hypothetical protein
MDLWNAIYAVISDWETSYFSREIRDNSLDYSRNLRENRRSNFCEIKEMLRTGDDEEGSPGDCPRRTPRTPGQPFP